MPIYNLGKAIRSSIILAAEKVGTNAIRCGAIVTPAGTKQFSN